MAPPPRPLLLGGILQVAGWLVLTFLSLGYFGSPGFAYEIDNNLTPTGTFVVIQGCLWLILMATFLWIRREKSPPGTTAFILGISICLRLIAIPGEPIHESDFYRYLWDGKVSNHQINPYRFEPGALYLEEKALDFEFEDKTTGVTWRGRNFSDREKQILDRLRKLRDQNPLLFERVSHPAVTTIYPPAAQWIFQLNQALFGDSILGMKALFVLFDIGVISLIILILPKVRRSPSCAILYAWNPLPIKEFANSAHYDSAAIFFMLLAVWLALLPWPPIRRTILVSLALALGTLTKYFAILLLPVLLISIQGRPNQRSKTDLLSQALSYIKAPPFWIGIVVFIAATGLGFFPSLLWDHAGVSEVFRGLATYQEHWQYSPGLFALIERGLGLLTASSFSAARKVAVLLVCGTVLMVALFSRRDPGGKCFTVMAALFLLSPTAFPWYFCWVLAFVPFQNRMSWLALGVLLPLNYLDFHSQGDLPLANVRWAGFYATQILSWGIFLITWISESLRRHFV